MAAHAFETLLAAGEPEGMRLVGLHAMDTLRLEKGFRHMGHDITPEDHVLEAGLGFACRKTGGHVGAEAVAAVREAGVGRRMLQFVLDDAGPELHHGELILRDGTVVGHLSSGGYGHALGAAVGLGYVPCRGESVAELLTGRWEIEIAGTRVTAEASSRPMYDPAGERMRG